MKRLLYLAHDLDDAAIWRRVAMLRRAGITVDVAGFRRGDVDVPEQAIVLGQTSNARMLARAGSVLRQRLSTHPALLALPRPDAILARNLEMLAIGVPLRARLSAGRHLPLVYEVLDIHRLMIGDGAVTRLLRRIERTLCCDVDRLLVSSPAFVRAYFQPHGQFDGPVTLVENKVFGPVPNAPTHPAPGDALRIGWFGILRCAVTLQLIDAVTRARPGAVKVIMRGRPALDTLPDFHEVVAANPDLRYDGPYTYPDDLAAIYGAVDLAWLVDRYDAGKNSDWLLPNRLYESGVNGVPPIGLDGTEVANQMRALGIGVTLDAADTASVARAINALTPERLAALRQAQDAMPRSTWVTGESECRTLAEDIFAAPSPAPYSAAVPDPAPGKGAGNGILVCIPTLNEADHIGDVIEALIPSLKRLSTTGIPTRLVVVDGGSRDTTRDVAQGRAAAHDALDIQVLDNPKRLQSAAINLAVAQHGDGMEWLLRMDAHAAYPADYIEMLLEEARDTGADSVVVAMHAVGTTHLQQVIAATQNSRLGNGGAAHRTGGNGRWVAHGHHALMRVAVFAAVGGYDESFSHNEDAELDIRLAQAGSRIWLTARTGLDYVPRNRLPPLIRQYWNFGRGRARTLLKHRLLPRLRQSVIIAVAPAAALSLLAPLHSAFLLPVVTWAGACLIGGAALAVSSRNLGTVAAGPIAATMHLAWSTGFWRQLLLSPSRQVPRHAAPATSIPPGPVAVGVCTFRRPGLQDTLETLERQDLPDGVPVTLIIADNDDTPSARTLVEASAAQSQHTVIYLHAPRANISIARNAILERAEQLDIPHLAFIDDDELAPAHWLQALLSALARGDADAIVGPVRATYSTDAPEWMHALRIHDTQPELDRDGRPIAGHSCNIIMDLHAPSLRGRRFELDRGLSGGEDTAFFEAARRDGARLGFAPDASLDEPVTPSRARLNWLLRRRFRMGQTHGSLMRQGKGQAQKAAALLRALAKLAYCAVGVVLSMPFERMRNRNLLRGALHAGTVSALLGAQTVEIYGTAGEPNPKDFT